MLVGRGDLALGLQLGAVLKRREGRFDVRVEGHQLAVQDHACRVLPPQLGGKPRPIETFARFVTVSAAGVARNPLLARRIRFRP